eukprot:TRINITY_DN28562_c0_g1_i1.p1 TRINITY_DN28562_c0_g1~~TRINITY_DN28562_c0_g1_i1.p1  ORF type:complete len:237 (+),score=97.10 TRINITY_DN28562_c0_g1_i1:50-760(+)
MARGQDVLEEEDLGLGVVFAVAEDEGNCKPFAGLSLLSQVCVEENIPGTHLISTIDAIPACKRVGLRKPCNEAREGIVLLESVEGMSLREIYLYYCRQYQSKPNSVLLKSVLAEASGDFSIATIDCSGNFVGDKGLLALLEVIRVCTSCTALLLPDNGIKNAGVECLVHMALEHPSLKHIDLSKNRITLGAGKVLQELCAKNPNIHKCAVSGTRIDPQLQERIQQRINHNIEMTTA